MKRLSVDFPTGKEKNIKINKQIDLFSLTLIYFSFWYFMARVSINESAVLKTFLEIENSRIFGHCSN
jgi:hypothetical protein